MLLVGSYRVEIFLLESLIDLCSFGAPFFVPLEEGAIVYQSWLLRQDLFDLRESDMQEEVGVIGSIVELVLLQGAY